MSFGVPGAMVPALVTRPVMVPMPCSVAPGSMDVGDVMLPSRTSVPSATLVAPV